jgi:hypothetical protein
MTNPDFFPPKGYYRADDAYRHWMEVRFSHRQLTNEEIDNAREQFISWMEHNQPSVNIYTEDQSLHDVPATAWDRKFFPDLLVHHKSIPFIGGGPFERYTGAILIVHRVELDSWATSSLREELFAELNQEKIDLPRAREIAAKAGISSLEWRAPIAIWDFALAKRNHHTELAGRLVAEIYTAFWKEELGLAELSLVEDKLFNQPGVVPSPRLSREYLAGCALGRIGEQGYSFAFEQLAKWNIGDYSKVGDSYRYYFVPEHGIGSLESQGRGLCAPPDVLEAWYSKQHSPQPEPMLQNSTAEIVVQKKKSKPKSKSFKDERVVKFFEDRVPEYLPDDYPPTEDKDKAAAEKLFPDIGRKQVRRCRAIAYSNQRVGNWIHPGPNNKTVGQLALSK